MYGILIASALAIYSIILADFAFLFKEVHAQTDLLQSTQALYAAESAVEMNIESIGEQVVLSRNKVFSQHEQPSAISPLTFNEGIEAIDFKTNLNLNHQNLSLFPHLNSLNQKSDLNEILFDIHSIDDTSYYALEAEKFKSFILRDVKSEDNFNEIIFNFNLHDENSELIFDLFVFPKIFQGISLKHFDELKNKPTSNEIKRISINTKSKIPKTYSYEGETPLKIEVQQGQKPYKGMISISGFQPLVNNYILSFQTLDQLPIHYKLSAFYQGGDVVLPNFKQTFDVIGSTSTGLYQRIKYQRDSEEGIAPGLNFVHFSEGDIVK